MNLADVKTKIKSLDYLIGQKIPGLNIVIDDIIPAPNDKTFDAFLDNYLYTGDIDKIIRLNNTKEFEILLLSGSKKNGIFDIKTKIYNAWYNDYFKDED